MKIIITILSLLAGTLAMGQQASYTNVNTSINDNGTSELAIQVRAERTDGQTVQYNRTFDVRGLTKAQRDALKNRVLDSLGVGNVPVPPVAPAAPVPPTPPGSPSGSELVTVVCESCTGRMRLEINGDGFNYTRTHDDTGDDKKAFADIEVPMKPGEYRLKYWQNKVLQIQKSFTVRAGEKNVISVK